MAARPEQRPIRLCRGLRRPGRGRFARRPGVAASAADGPGPVRHEQRQCGLCRCGRAARRGVTEAAAANGEVADPAAMTTPALSLPPRPRLPRPLRRGSGGGTEHVVDRRVRPGGGPAGARHTRHRDSAHGGELCEVRRRPTARMRFPGGQRHRPGHRPEDPTGRSASDSACCGAHAGPAADAPPPWNRVPGRSLPRCSSTTGPPSPPMSRPHGLPRAAAAPPPTNASPAVPRVAPPSRSGRARPPRQAALQLKRLDPWSVLKLALVLAVVLFLIWLVAVGVLYGCSTASASGIGSTARTPIWCPARRRAAAR